MLRIEGKLVTLYEVVVAFISCILFISREIVELEKEASEFLKQYIKSVLTINLGLF